MNELLVKIITIVVTMQFSQGKCTNLFIELTTSYLDVCEPLQNISVLPCDLKTPWTLLVIVKDQSSHLVYLNICIK